MQESQSFLRMDAAGALITYPLMNTLASTRSSVSAFLLVLAGVLTQSCYTSVSAAASTYMPR